MTDHAERMRRARLALEGQALGDAFGGRFLQCEPAEVLQRLATREAPPAPWPYTAHTAMALGLAEVLGRCGGLDQDLLSLLLARNYARAPHRGYSNGTRSLLERVGRGVPWQVAARSAFRGNGSPGLGGAARVAPLAGYLAEDPALLAIEARRSAEVTHCHPDGVAGAVAVAAAGSAAWRLGAKASFEAFLGDVIERTPTTAVREGLVRAYGLGGGAPLEEAVAWLGHGVEGTAADTVPLALWCAARHLGSLEDALWEVVAAGGACHALGALVGGVLALSVGWEGLPRPALERREALPPLEDEP